MNVWKKAKQLEKTMLTDRLLPVLIVDHEDEIKHYESQIGENTVIFIDDVKE